MEDKAPTLTVVERIEKVFDANAYGFVDVKLGNDWRLSTKKAAVANQARQYEGQGAVALDYFERQKGEYTNRYLVAVREPAADEVPLQDAAQKELAAVGAQRVNGGSSQDEFRRSKEEMRWTEALHMASRMGAENPTQLELLATQIQNVIQPAQVAQDATETDEDFGF